MLITLLSTIQITRLHSFREVFCSEVTTFKVAHSAFPTLESHHKESPFLEWYFLENLSHLQSRDLPSDESSHLDVATYH